jgi:hypothetical protein
MPRAEAGIPAGTLSPLRMLVMNDRGALRVTGTILNPVSPGLTVLCGVSGTRPVSSSALPPGTSRRSTLAQK